MKTTGIVTCLLCAAAAQAQSTRPASQPVSQPATPTLARYYSLMKNEFMKADVLVPSDVQAAIAQMRKKATADKTKVDAQIAALTKDIQEQDQKIRASKQNERDLKAKAANRANGILNYNSDSRGRVNSIGVRAAQRAYGDGHALADAAHDKTKDHKQDLNAMRADLVQLKKESATLAPICSPYTRSLPPKKYWQDLPPAVQDDLARIGIPQDAFKKVIESRSYTERSFVTAASRIDKQTKDPTALVARRREVLIPAARVRD